ncbi:MULTISPECIES: hypothetical protein [unclassified Campylobacter]|uniref:hypothetical protein n=1 Tax=unclassified Campylobacter TaxID=2593542 RepID=UPI00115C9ACE|nr:MULTISPECIES: hypothetical protein [unclassified Campylobacter]NDJ26341.1 hypothetical protein [Campylobacter sp. MIT 19-121]
MQFFCTLPLKSPKKHPSHRLLPSRSNAPALAQSLSKQSSTIQTHRLIKQVFALLHLHSLKILLPKVHFYDKNSIFQSKFAAIFHPKTQIPSALSCGATSQSQANANRVGLGDTNSFSC